MVTKMADKIGLKQRNCHFGLNLRLLKTDFLRIRYQQKRIPPKNLIICCVLCIFSTSVKISFRYLLVLYINFSVKCLKIAPKWSHSYFQPILVAIFFTIATVKVESTPDFYTWAIVLIN